MDREFLGVWIPKEIYLHKQLTPTEKLLLAEIACFKKNGICFASNTHFAEFLGISKGHVSKLLTKLARLGLITVELTYKEGTKEVEKRTLTPILIKEHTPTHVGVDPLLAEDYTPTREGVDPILVEEYYKEHIKIQVKEQVKIQKEIKTNTSELEREFEQLWKNYPRKLGKKKAFDSYKKVRKIKKVPYETIESGLYRYIDYCKTRELDEQYIQHGSTWFNQEKWQDDFISIAPQKKATSFLDYYKEDFGGENNGFSGHSEVIEYDTTLIPEPSENDGKRRIRNYG